MMRGIANATKELIAVVKALLVEDHPQTLRHIHYRLLNFPGFGYRNDVASYRRLSRTLTWARRVYRQWELSVANLESLGVSRLAAGEPAFGISPLWIVDEERQAEAVNVWRDAAEYVETVRVAYRRDNWQSQPHHCEVWGEKKAVLASLRPIVQRWGVTLRACKGFGSAGMEDSAGRLFENINKPITVLYVGDHDASGRLIEEDMHRRVQVAADTTFTMERLAIHAEDIDKFNLAPQAIKETDTRAPAFRRRFGHDAPTVELEALPSAELKRRVNEAIVSLIDFDSWDRQVEVQEVELKSIEEFAANLRNLPQIEGAA